MFKAKDILTGILIDDKKELFEKLCAIDNTLPDTLKAILEEINTFDPELLEFWEKEKLSPKLITYLIHYIIPFRELIQASHSNNISRVLAIELISFFAWRTFDNCVDGHGPVKTAHLNSLASCMKLIDISQSCFPNLRVNDIYEYYRIMTEQSLQESEQPISIDHIWKRCSIVFYAAEILISLDKELISLFKTYINYTGLVHDMTDIANDISNQIISLPVYWLSENSDIPTISSISLKHLYEKAKIEIKPLKEEFESKKVKNRFPLMNYLISQADSAFRED